MAAGALMGLMTKATASGTNANRDACTFEPIVDEAGDYTPAFRFTTDLTGERVYHVLVLREEDDWR